jgi:glutamyl-tRNA reductase
MQIQCIGLSHKTADVSLREKLSNLEHRLHEQASELPGCTSRPQSYRERHR